eukprot:TRINITY_DN20385_c0_g1_i1.p1 TRINITY_DN20385_c0_g1~~TRINITY_DN20385_c0_g1_i1.p1  ORF type:complete len:414 (-),score=62.43 TRINITY_DN20385_c0_g1_i1:48-1289(-)
MGGVSTNACEGPQDRGAEQIMPPTRHSGLAATMAGKPSFQEHVFLVEITCPQDALRGVYNILVLRRGCVFGVNPREGVSLMQVRAYLLVPESFGLQSALRQATSGHGSPQNVFEHWNDLPEVAIQTGRSHSGHAQTHEPRCEGRKVGSTEAEAEASAGPAPTAEAICETRGTVGTEGGFNAVVAEVDTLASTVGSNGTAEDTVASKPAVGATSVVVDAVVAAKSGGGFAETVVADDSTPALRSFNSELEMPQAASVGVAASPHLGMPKRPPWADVADDSEEKQNVKAVQGAPFRALKASRRRCKKKKGWVGCCFMVRADRDGQASDTGWPDLVGKSDGPSVLTGKDPASVTCMLLFPVKSCTFLVSSSSENGEYTDDELSDAQFMWRYRWDQPLSSSGRRRFRSLLARNTARE